jgi:hypothetical protein
MPRWLGSLSNEQLHALNQVFKKLKAHAPERWSIVKGESGLVIRPADRRVGKFSLTPSTDGGYYVAYYSQRKARWTNEAHFSVNDDLAANIMEWMASIATRAQLIVTEEGS